MFKLALPVLALILASCDPEPPNADSIKHDFTYEYTSLPPAAQPGNDDTNVSGYRLFCWEQEICNVPCIVCHGDKSYSISCDYSRGKRRCGVVLPRNLNE